MRLTRYTDYALRVLLYLGARPERLCSISEISKAYGVSQNHLMKVVNDLARAGYVASARGRSGGIRLGAAPDAIGIGTVVRHTEDGFQMADCGNCLVAPACGMQGVLNEATRAFLGVLDRYTLADMLAKRDAMRALFGIDALLPAPVQSPAGPI